VFVKDSREKLSETVGYVSEYRALFTFEVVVYCMRYACAPEVLPYGDTALPFSTHLRLADVAVGL
jgi:hypothetical protein